MYDLVVNNFIGAYLGESVNLVMQGSILHIGDRTKHITNLFPFSNDANRLNY